MILGVEIWNKEWIGYNLRYLHKYIYLTYNNLLIVLMINTSRLYQLVD
jgi:hypothetical protein